MAHIADLIQACRVCCWEALVMLVPELKNLEGQSQHYGAGVDVAEHTRLMLVQCPKDDDVLLLACLLHDIAKPVCAEPKPGGKPGYQFPNHGPEGASMTFTILQRFEGYLEVPPNPPTGMGDENWMDRVAALVCDHMQPHDGHVPNTFDRERLVDLAELDSASFLNRSIGKVRERFNALRVKHNLPERPFPPPEHISKALEEYQLACLQGKESRHGPQAP